MIKYQNITFFYCEQIIANPEICFLVLMDFEMHSLKRFLIILNSGILIQTSYVSGICVGGSCNF
uniref:Uncharacterized protein n=1 Tax=Rhizophora mucronata TaxID=61149 RepID=A0A2P2Q325_RHIMU